MNAKEIKIKFILNEIEVNIKAYPMKRLIDVLREDFSITGTKEGCGEGECGACAILINGELINSCLVPIIQVQDMEVTTIEGISKNDELDIIQKAFLEKNGVQCGICTPGMVLASANLLSKNSKPKIFEIKEALSGNLCRCTGHMKIFDAVKLAGSELRRKK